MNPRSIAVNALPMLVMANGMQNGFIFLCPIHEGFSPLNSFTQFSVAVVNECKPPIALPMRHPARVLSTMASISSPLANGIPADWSAFLAATIWYAMNGSTRRAIFFVMNSSGSKPFISPAITVPCSSCGVHSVIGEMADSPARSLA